MTTVVLGFSGQLARHLREQLPDAVFWGRAEVDVADSAALESRLEALQPAAIINASGYTAVDRAESEPDIAWRVNAEAPATMARVAQRRGIPLVHVSTDYVFDGARAEGYVESDAVRPLNVYGRSKLGGELAVQTLCHHHWIFRTSWVFSEHGTNFPKTILRLARERPELRIVADQRGRPTYAGDLALCIVLSLQSVLQQESVTLPWGTHHVGDGPVVSWKELADRVIAGGLGRGLLSGGPAVQGITTAEYPTPAMRPRNSVLLTREEHAFFVRQPFSWERGLDLALTALT